ncbi:MAG: hypothetical protein ABJA20_09175 [Novosphingobium sp.]
MDIIARAVATTASTKANAASATANSVSATANTALTTANAASATATAASTTANSVAATANTALTTANAASATANAASTTANSVAATANTALTTATAASASATTALTTANAASATANSVSATANTALSTANAASATASSASTVAAQALAKAAPFDVFTAIGAKTIDPAITAILTSGYTTVGVGGAIYVADALATSALATAHPRFCKVTANGRYFRLLGDSANEITVRQGGAIGNSPGTNAQPAIQAAINYACAVGIPTVYFPDDCELWCPLVTGGNGLTGTPIIIPTTGGLRLRGRPDQTKLALKNSAGGSKNTVTQTLSSAPWGGGGVRVSPNGGFAGGTMQWVAIDSLNIDGGVTYNPADRSNTDVFDKGFWADCAIGKVDFRNVTLKNFGGEIYYMGGSNVGEQYLENCVFDGSPQSALNAGGSGSTFVGINVQAGNSYQACEVLGGNGFTMIGGRLYDFYSSTIFGGPDPTYLGGYPYNFPVRASTRRPPWIFLDGVRVEGAVDALSLGSWTRGRLIATDAVIALGPMISDVNIEIEAWLDQRTGTEAVRIGGPPTATTQMSGAPVGTFMPVPSNLNVKLTCKRTALAQANNRSFSSGLRIYAGLVDKDTCQFAISGDADQVFQIQGTAPAGFALPLISADNFRSTGQPYGGGYDYPAADTAYNVQWSAMAFSGGSGAPKITIGTGYAYANGQKVTFYKQSGSASPTFQASASTFKLPADRVLANAGDRIELVYDSVIGKWVESLFEGQQAAGGSISNGSGLSLVGSTLAVKLGSGLAFDGSQNVTVDATAGSGVLKYGRIVMGEAAGGLTNGANVTYTLANTPQNGAVALFVNGVRQQLGAGKDFTLSGLTITMTAAPAATDVLIADYVY